eukprot:TRINITY_DN998_c0_g1_i1.p1 TRINITY_DN998_c0_g1~~TRINITY_DN998_c0_g1_i1.p1  ORF type:complete len:318 (-),score=37.80 TRINITY_DN998_c0_g1_i1:154-1107(-)
MLVMFGLWCLLLVVEVLGDCGPDEWIVLNVSGLPPLDGTERVVVTNLVSALLECTEGDILTRLNGYHGGLGFTVYHPSQPSQVYFEISLNYDAYPTFLGSIFPSMQYGLSGVPSMSWSAEGKVFVYEGINITFWDPEKYGTKQIGEINGTVLKDYLEWIVQYNNSNDPDQIFYDAVGLYTYYPMRPWDKVWFPSHECFSFVWESIHFFAEKGIIFDVKSAKQSVIAIFTTKDPVPISMDDPVQRQAVLTFYQIISELLYQDTIAGVINAIREVMVNHQWYMHHRGEHYLIYPEFPYISTYFVELPFPPFDDDTLLHG